MYEPEVGEKDCVTVSSGHDHDIHELTATVIIYRRPSQDDACYCFINHEEGAHKDPLLRDCGQITGSRGGSVLFFSGVASDNLTHAHTSNHN